MENDEATYHSRLQDAANATALTIHSAEPTVNTSIAEINKAQAWIPTGSTFDPNENIILDDTEYKAYQTIGGTTSAEEQIRQFVIDSAIIQSTTNNAPSEEDNEGTEGVLSALD